MFIPDFSSAQNMVRVFGVKLNRNDLRGKKYFEVAGGLNYGGFELLWVKLQ